MTQSRSRQSSILYYVATDQQPVQIEIQYQSEQPNTFRIIETSYDLPQHLPNFIARPEYIMPTPFKVTDAIIISQPISHTNR
ncbi:hypothetical protein [Aliiglaciecola lipolytica]|uniref:Uncharacterized protein n=1 Tax=Aliiglaciecola lipolytica E3 TaxID=1127673 RepID=K6Y8E9_9ALTE|nr:hypothetical protein [Aliiglaciecola lipolytica]GAC14482.1 hypothetical protein GLIP_1853 [Aliiglaciecola lipolytica E3]